MSNCLNGIESRMIDRMTTSHLACTSDSIGVLAVGQRLVLSGGGYVAAQPRAT
jgi:hypothetical protein